MSTVPDEKAFILTISKEELAALPIARFNGKIRIIDNADQVSEAIEALRRAEVIGFDTETRPSFKKGTINEVSLLQLSDSKTSYLFRINRIGMPEALVKFLEDENILKIGLSIHDDFHNLSRICEFSPEGFIDLQEFVKKYSIADNSLSKIYAILFGQRISKGQRLTNWEAASLSAAQQSYASLDAVACVEIYNYLKSDRFECNNSAYRHSRAEIEAINAANAQKREAKEQAAATPEKNQETNKLSKSARRRRNKAARKLAASKKSDVATEQTEK